MVNPEHLARIIGTPVKLTLCGLDFAGKTALLYRWKTGKFNPNLSPTLSPTLESVSIRGGLVSATVFDLGGQEKLRKQWKKYLEEGNAIIFVIDAYDKERYLEVKAEFDNRVIPELGDKPCAVICNKLDLIYKKNQKQSINDLIIEVEKTIQNLLNLSIKKEDIGQFDVIATSMVNGLGLKKIAQFLRLKLASS
ncbi:MAG: ADP-ribosylation factor-like protein [Candidatus Hermodarchaeota archaeon]